MVMGEANLMVMGESLKPSILHVGSMIYRLCLALFPALLTRSFVASLAFCRPLFAWYALPPIFPTALLTASVASANPTMFQLMVLGNLSISSSGNSGNVWGPLTFI